MPNQEIKFTINQNPRTKKNSQQIFINKKTKKPFITQSKIYKQYEKDCRYFIPKHGIDYKVNVRAIYYRQTMHRVDLSNLNAALHDILVKYGCLKDDNYKIIDSTDGSRVIIDKDNPRTEVIITRKE